MALARIASAAPEVARARVAPRLLSLARATAISAPRPRRPNSSPCRRSSTAPDPLRRQSLRQRSIWQARSSRNARWCQERSKSAAPAPVEQCGLAEAAGPSGKETSAAPLRLRVVKRTRSQGEQRIQDHATPPAGLGGVVVTEGQPTRQGPPPRPPREGAT